MSRARLAALLCTAAVTAAAAAAGGGVLWAHTASEPAAPTPTPGEPANPGARPPAALPAAGVLTGAAGAILADADLAPEPANPADLAGWACTSGPAPWLAADAATTTVPGAAVTTTVAATRAGHAEAVYRAWRDSLAGCGRVDDDDGRDTFTWQSGPRTLTVSRHGDVLTFTAAAGRRAVAADAADAADAWAERVLPGVCADPSGEPTGAAGRDPYAATYTGYTARDTLTTGLASPLTVTDVTTIGRIPTDPTWSPPAPVAHPDLAVGGVAPVFTDPDLLPTPDGDDPGDVADMPASPQQVPASATIDVPAADTVGPGCGWVFAATTAPTVDTAALTAAQRSAWLAGLTALAADQGNWFTAWVGWPAQVRTWAASATAAANWRAYRDAYRDADDARSTARWRYQRWLDAQTAPTPSRTAPPAPSLTALPEPTPTAPPAPTFTAPAPTPTYTPPTPEPTYTPPTPDPTYTPPTPDPTYSPPTPDPTYIPPTPDPTYTPPTPDPTVAPPTLAPADGAAESSLR